MADVLGGSGVPINKDAAMEMISEYGLHHMNAYTWDGWSPGGTEAHIKHALDRSDAARYYQCETIWFEEDDFPGCASDWPRISVVGAPDCVLRCRDWTGQDPGDWDWTDQDPGDWD